MAGKSIEAGRAFLKLDIDDRAFDKKLAGISRKFKNAGRSIRAVGIGIGAFGAAITTPLVFAIKKASEAQEVFNKFEVVFGNQSKAVKAWGDELAFQVGRGTVEILKAAAGLQDLFIPLGLATDTATDLSKSLVALAIDLGSFNDVADADVMNDIQRAMTGSSVTMKKYGVVVDTAAVSQELLNQGFNPEFANNAQKAIARYNIIIRDTKTAHGDAANTLDSFANRMKELQSNIGNSAEALGDLFLPAATEMVKVASDIVKALSNWSSENEAITKTIGALGLGASGAGVSLYAFAAALGAVTIAVNALTVAALWFKRTAVFALFTSHPVIAGIVALTLAIAKLAEHMGYLGIEAKETTRSLEEVAAIKLEEDENKFRKKEIPRSRKSEAGEEAARKKHFAEENKQIVDRYNDQLKIDRKARDKAEREWLRDYEEWADDKERARLKENREFAREVDRKLDEEERWRARAGKEDQRFNPIFRDVNVAKAGGTAQTAEIKYLKEINQGIHVLVDLARNSDGVLVIGNG